MTESVQTALIASIVPTITAIGVIIVALRQKIAEKKVDDLHIVVNSRLTELLKVTTESEHAKGKLEGKAEEKIEIHKNELNQLNQPNQSDDPVKVKIVKPDIK